MPAALLGRVDREALEVPAPGRSAGDQVAADLGVDRHPEAPRRAWRRARRPARARRGARTCRTRPRRPPAPRPGRSAGPAGAARPVAGARGRVERSCTSRCRCSRTTNPASTKRRHLGAGQRAGDDLVDAPPAEHGDAVAHRGTVGRHRAGHRGDQRHPLVAVAGDDAEAVGSDPEQLGLGHGDPAWSFTRSPRIGLDTTAGGARSVRSRAVTLLVVTDPRFLDHDTGAGHPERPTRLRAVDAGIAAAGLGDAIVHLARRAGARAPRWRRCTQPELIDALERFCAAGGGAIDADTRFGPSSFEVAHARGRAPASSWSAGSTPGRGRWASARCGRRATTPPPPGRMGFCLFNNVAVTAAALADRGERVAIVDYDAHHGNGTQDIFYEDPRVLYVSLHEWPLYPGTGRARRGRRAAPARARPSTSRSRPAPRATCTGGPSTSWWSRRIERFAPTWLLLSAGFDAHRADPLTGLALSSGDFADLTAPAGRARPAGPAPPLPRGRLRPRGAARLGRLRRSPRRSVSTCGPSRRRAATRAPIGWPPSSTSTGPPPTDRSADRQRAPSTFRRTRGSAGRPAAPPHRPARFGPADQGRLPAAPAGGRAAPGRPSSRRWARPRSRRSWPSCCPPAKAEELIDTGEVDVAHSVAGLGRFRVNVYRQRGSLGPGRPPGRAGRAGHRRPPPPPR